MGLHAFRRNLVPSSASQATPALSCSCAHQRRAGAMSSQNLPSLQEARQLRTSGMDANQMYEEVRAIAGESGATPLSRGPQRSSHAAGEVRRAPPPRPASPLCPPRRPPRRATQPPHANSAPLARPPPHALAPPSAAQG